jgi:phosphatidylglycerol---prolipoprotein diacylglyceryl transferase
MSINFLHSYVPDSIAFSIGSLSLHWYGLFLTMAILAGYFISIELAKRSGFKEEIISTLYINVLIAGLVGARVYHVITEFSFYWDNLGQVFAIWNGGLAIHGGMIGGILMVLYYVKKHKQNFWKIADLFVIPAILGQAIGRWGNYFNQELFGKPTGSVIGIPIELSNRPQEFLRYEYFHPTFLYESIINLIILGILLFVFKTEKRPAGLIFWMYVGLYSLGRIVVESLRINDAAFVFGIRLPLLVSVLLVLVSIFYLKRLTMTRNNVVR